MQNQLSRHLFLLSSLLALTWAVPMRAGLKDHDPFSKMEAEVMNYAVNAVIYGCDTCSGGQYVGNLDDGEAIGYSNVDFQNGADGLQISISGWQPNDETGTVSLRLDYPGGAPFATVTTQNTGGTLAFVTDDVSFDPPITGVHHLYFTFVSNTNSTTNVCNLDWFQFHPSPVSTTVPVATT